MNECDKNCDHCPIRDICDETRTKEFIETVLAVAIIGIGLFGTIAIGTCILYHSLKLIATLIF